MRRTRKALGVVAVTVAATVSMAGAAIAGEVTGPPGSARRSRREEGHDACQLELRLLRAERLRQRSDGLPRAVLRAGRSAAWR